MNFISRVSPNYRDKQSTVGMMVELTIGLLVVLAASVYYYTTKVDLTVGLRVLYVAAAAVLSNIVIEVAVGLKNKKSVKDVFVQEFPWVTGLIFALCIPVTTNLYVVAMSTAIGVIFGKVIFGGFGQNIFNPAGVARAIVFSSFAKPVVESVVKTSDVFTSATPANLMASFSWLPSAAAFDSKAFTHLGLKQLLMGDHFGAIGETFALVLIIVGIVLAIRKVIDFRMPLIYVTTLFVSAGIIGMINGLGVWYPLAFVMSGGALFGAVFMITDPVTCPTQKTGRVIFAFGAAIITLLIRFKANLPEGVVFSILIMNMLTPVIEDFLDGQQTQMKKTYLISALSMVLITGLSVTWVAASTKAVEPVLDLGVKTTIVAEEVTRYETEITNQSVDGANTVFIVAAEGYGLKDSEYPNPAYTENIFEITVETASSKIVSISMTQFGDTKGFGDIINDDLYFDKFIGKDLSNDSEEYDTVSNATKTSYSLISALNAVAQELEK
ncbi:MAG: RnfABCDGE type electron transport complex subunit D [Erysipelothrix sp.]|nr:RnfABCDGE type electron transport complex subunit D [Erysipelothrix sp.]